MLEEGLLKLHKSSLKCKAKGTAKKEQLKKKFFQITAHIFFSFFFISTPPTS
jgi:hypothetical protein